MFKKALWYLPAQQLLAGREACAACEAKLAFCSAVGHQSDVPRLCPHQPPRVPVLSNWAVLAEWLKGTKAVEHFGEAGLTNLAQVSGQGPKFGLVRVCAKCIAWSILQQLRGQLRRQECSLQCLAGAVPGAG